MNLRSKSDHPNRKRHSVRPAWEDELEAVTADEDPLRQTPEYRRIVAEVERRAGGECESGSCDARGVDPHHIYPTSEGGPVVCPPIWLLWLCRSCHAAIHSDVRAIAEGNGWIVPKDRKPV